MKKIIEEYLLKSGYNKFINSNDLKPITVDKVHHKSSIEINDSIHFFFIIQGNMDVFFPDQEGKNHLMARVYANDYQLGGIIRYFKKKISPMDDYIFSLSKGSVCYGINQQKIDELLKNYSFVEFIFEKYIIFTSNILQENYLKSVFSLEEYLAYILYHHSIEGVYKVTNFSIFSNLLKCNRTSLYKILSNLKDKGILEKNGKFIKVISMEKLKLVFEKNFN